MAICKKRQEKLQNDTTQNFCTLCQRTEYTRKRCRQLNGAPQGTPQNFDPGIPRQPQRGVANYLGNRGANSHTYPNPPREIICNL